MTKVEMAENTILEHRLLAQDIHLFKVHTPDLAAACKPGQFVVVRADERGERVPLTIADFHRAQGWIVLIVQTLGASTLKMASFREIGRAHV